MALVPAEAEERGPADRASRNGPGFVTAEPDPLRLGRSRLGVSRQEAPGPRIAGFAPRTPTPRPFPHLSFGPPGRPLAMPTQVQHRPLADPRG